MKALAIIFGLISEAWGLIFKVAIVIVAIVFVMGFLRSCSTSVNEHSSCQQFEQADSSTQDKVLQDMMTAHHDSGSIATTRLSVGLYCQLHGDSSPIDGVYSSSNVGLQSAQALHPEHW